MPGIGEFLRERRFAGWALGVWVGQLRRHSPEVEGSCRFLTIHSLESSQEGTPSWSPPCQVPRYSRPEDGPGWADIPAMVIHQPGRLVQDVRKPGALSGRSSSPSANWSGANSDRLRSPLSFLPENGLVGCGCQPHTLGLSPGRCRDSQMTLQSSSPSRASPTRKFSPVTSFPRCAIP